MTPRTSQPPSTVPTLCGERIILRGLRPTDTPALCRHANHPEVSRWMPNLPYPFTTRHAGEVIRKSTQKALSCSGYYFGIELAERAEVIGIIGLKDIEWTDRNCDVGYWIGREFRRQGLMEEALRLALHFAFRDLRLHRVSALVIGPNIASSALLEKVGFRLEGRWRKDCHLRRRWYDALVFGLLDREFPSDR